MSSGIFGKAPVNKGRREALDDGCRDVRLMHMLKRKFNFAAGMDASKQETIHVRFRGARPGTIFG